MIELLAPVGSREALVAAVESGANAVYMGGKAFGARHYAPNFTDDELAEAVRFAHLRNVLVYVTVNTLVDDSEIPSLVEYLRHLYTIGIDAIIVQDVGVAAIARKIVPSLEIHASTQMTVHNLAGVELLGSHGFSRVVLAREVSIEDIGYICKHTSIEIETFIHGALCISYSGQCLMSSVIGGRSGNRGRCAQPCRLPYTLVDKTGANVLAGTDAGEYLLSPRDLNTIELIPTLITKGVASFKIEGRMKRPEYVAIVVDAYRKAIDAYVANRANYIVTDQTYKDLGQVFNREFTTAYLQKKQGRLMMSDRRPNNRGVRIGRVVFYDGVAKKVVIKLDGTLTIGDMVEIWVKVGDRVNATVSAMTVQGKAVTVAMAGMDVSISVHGLGISITDWVFKTFDVKLMERARGFYQSASAVLRIPVDVTVEASVGQPLMITLRDDEGCIGHGQTDFLGAVAQKRPLTEETVRKQVDRLGTSVFALHSFKCHIDDQVMVPMSEMNEARRRAVEDLEDNRLTRFCRAPLITIPFSLPSVQTVKTTRPELAVQVDTVKCVQEAVDNGADWIVFGGESYHHRPFSTDDYQQVVEICRKAKAKIMLNTPRIVKEWQWKGLEQDLALFAKLGPDAVGISNLGTLYLMTQRYSSIALHGEFSLNVYNSVAVEYFRCLKLNSLTLSPELTFDQIKAIVTRSKVPLECIVHGYLPVMISEYCAIGGFLGQLHTGACSHICLKSRYWLKDRKDEIFPVATDQYCRMHILNAKELHMAAHVPKFGHLGINRIRIEAKGEEPMVVSRVTRLYREILDMGDKHPLIQEGKMSTVEHGDITRGHYFRGIL